MSKLEFERLLRETPPSSLDWTMRRDTWAAKLEALYAQVEQWLRPYIDSGEVATARAPRRIEEEGVPPYEVDSLRIDAQGREAQLNPAGTFIIGARGRVDLVGRHGVARLLLVPPMLTRPRLLIMEDYRTGGSVESTAGPMVDDVWKWASQVPNVRYTALDEESFFAELTQVLNGLRG